MTLAYLLKSAAGAGLVVEAQESVFTTTATTKAVTTKLRKVIAAVAVPVGAYAGTDLLESPAAQTVSGGSVTVTRGAGTTSAMKFALVLFGEN